MVLMVLVVLVVRYRQSSAGPSEKRGTRGRSSDRHGLARNVNTFFTYFFTSTREAASLGPAIPEHPCLGQRVRSNQLQFTHTNIQN